MSDYQILFLCVYILFGTGFTFLFWPEMKAMWEGCDCVNRSKNE